MVVAPGKKETFINFINVVETISAAPIKIVEQTQISNTPDISPGRMSPLDKCLEGSEVRWGE